MKDYNAIMEFIENTFLGKCMKVTIHNNGLDEAVHSGYLWDAIYETHDGSLARRVTDDFEGKLKLSFGQFKTDFGQLKINLHSYDLQLSPIYEQGLQTPEDSELHLLCSGLDDALMVYLEREYESIDEFGLSNCP